MAVQGNLLGSSDLTRFVQAAQGNRPKSLGQIAEERRKERVAAERDLLKFAADLRLKRLDLKDAMEQRAAQTDIQRERLKLEDTTRPILRYQEKMVSQIFVLPSHYIYFLQMEKKEPKFIQLLVIALKRESCLIWLDKCVLMIK